MYSFIDQNKAYTKMHSNDSQVTLNDGVDYAIEDGTHYSFTCTGQGKASGDRNDCDNNRHINKHVKDDSLCRKSMFVMTQGVLSVLGRILGCE
jgi:hypothetical protein